jgi:hypothetical protein
VHPDPAPNTTSELADVFVNAGMRIDALLRAVLLHDEFWSTSSRYALVKSPVDLVVDVLRRTGLRIEDSGLHWGLPPMGQTLFDPPNVKGWGTNEYWLPTASIFGRGSWLRWVGWQLAGSGHWAGLEREAPTAGADRVFADLGVDQPSRATRDAFESWFAHAQQTKPWAIAANAFVVASMSPEFHAK